MNSLPFIQKLFFYSLIILVAYELKIKMFYSNENTFSTFTVTVRYPLDVARRKMQVAFMLQPKDSLKFRYFQIHQNNKFTLIFKKNI